MPSGKFGVNAAWWQIMVLALNLTVAMKRLVLDASWATKRLKALRFNLIHIAGRVMEGSRQIRIRLSQGHPVLKVFHRAREEIARLALVPGG